MKESSHAYQSLAGNCELSEGIGDKCAALCCSVLQCVVVCCSVLQCVAVCCSVLLCVAVGGFGRGYRRRVCCCVLLSVAVRCDVRV